MHFIARSQVRSEVHSWLHSIAHSQPAWLYAPNCTRWHTPSLLDCTLPIALDGAPQPAWITLPTKLSRRSQVHSEYAGKYTPGDALQDAPNQCF